MTPKLVIFDCDGVVVDSEPLANALVQEELAKSGLDLTIAQVTDLFFGGTMGGLAEKARALGADLPPEWVERSYARLFARLREGTPLIAGVAPVIQALHARRHPFCICSNGRHAKMQITLGQHPALWALLQDRLFSVEDVARPKPAPDLFLHAASVHSVAPQDCIVIEDSPTGARAAAGARMPCLGFAPHDTGARLAEHGAQVFHCMTDLPRLLAL